MTPTCCSCWTCGEAIEPLAARLAAGAATADRELVMKAYRSMEASVDSVRSFVTKDTRFHRSILQASGNIFLIATDNLLSSVLSRQIRLINRDTAINLGCLPLHLAVAEAIVAGKPEQAEKNMHVLLKDARHETRKILARQ